MTEPLPYNVAVTINSLVHLVQLRWHGAGNSEIVYALSDDDLAALNACFGSDWGRYGCSWESDRPAAVVIRELGEAQVHDDDGCVTVVAVPGPHEFAPASDTPGDCLVCKPESDEVWMVDGDEAGCSAGVRPPVDFMYLSSTPEFSAAVEAGGSVDLAKVRREVRARRSPALTADGQFCACGHTRWHHTPAFDCSACGCGAFIPEAQS